MDLRKRYIFQKSEISLNVITVSVSSRTIRLIERLGNQSVVILVDTRSSNNFLDPPIVKQLHSPDDVF